MLSSNGSTPPLPERGLRWVWFGGSIISDWNNPIATTNRAVIRALQHRGHQVMFLEPADHPAFHDALRTRGSAMYRAFQEVYPDIHYRRQTLPGGSEGDVWLSRESALADVLIVQDDAPAKILDWLGRVPPSPIVSIILASSMPESVGPSIADLILTPTTKLPNLMYGPAVLAGETPKSQRSGSLTVVYGGGPESGANVVAAGAAAPGHLPFIPEARLAERYRGVERVTIFDEDPSPFARARAMLAAAAGAQTTLVRPGSDPETVDHWTEAGAQVDRLIQQVIAIRARRLAIQE